MKKASDPETALAVEPILPDVNFLIGLGWTNHPFHAAAKRYMSQHRGLWMTCAITQLGFIRLSANPGVTKVVVTPGQAADFFLRLTQDPQHMYVNDTMSLVRSSVPQLLRKTIGMHQVTDAYLLTLAASAGARFVTFDGRLEKLGEGVCPVEILKP